MEVYKRETQEVIKRFLARRLSFPDCIAALDAALADLIPRLSGEQIPRLRIVMLANNEIVMNEMASRGPTLSDLSPEQIQQIIQRLIELGSVADPLGLGWRVISDTLGCPPEDSTKILRMLSDLDLIDMVTESGDPLANASLNSSWRWVSKSGSSEEFVGDSRLRQLAK